METINVWVIGFASSIVGGVLASWIVLRKNEHDLRRLYARQLFVDYGVFCDQTLRQLFRILDEVAPDIVPKINRDEIKLMNRVSKAELTNVMHKISDLTPAISAKLDSSDRDAFVILVRELLRVYERDFDEHFNKYPLQTAYFDDIYDVRTTIATNVLRLGNVSQATTLHVVASILELVIGVVMLKDVFSEIEYYRKSGPWSWRMIRVHRGRRAMSESGVKTNEASPESIEQRTLREVQECRAMIERSEKGSRFGNYINMLGITLAELALASSFADTNPYMAGGILLIAIMTFVLAGAVSRGITKLGRLPTIGALLTLAGTIMVVLKYPLLVGVALAVIGLLLLMRSNVARPD